MKKLISLILFVIMTVSLSMSALADSFDDYEFKSPEIYKESNQYRINIHYELKDTDKHYRVTLKDDWIQVEPSVPETGTTYKFVSWTIRTSKGALALLHSTVTSNGAVKSTDNVGNGQLTIQTSSGANFANLILYHEDGVTVATYGVDYTYANGVVTSLTGEPLVIKVTPLEDDLWLYDHFDITDDEEAQKEAVINKTNQKNTSVTSPKTGASYNILYALAAVVVCCGIGATIIIKKSH